MFLLDLLVSEPTFPAGIPVASQKARLLSSRDFGSCLERERCFADRGARFFTLIVVLLRRGDRSGLGQLSSRLRERLRFTDAVGHVSGDRLGVLLPDTGTEGARVVLNWVDGAAVSVGLGIERKAYIYPRVPGAGALGVRRRVEEANGPAKKPAGCGPSIPEIPEAPTVAAEISPGVVADPIEDLWPQLSVPAPAWKRGMDVALSALALLMLLPVFVVVAIAIRLDSPGPVIFSQPRAGRGGRPFVFYKFRSMFVDAEQRKLELQSLNEKAGPIFKIRHDPRITRVGAVLRHWSLDELPQLWNVLKGDFSLVGPRPPTLDEVAKYERWQMRRLDVAGGITGIWQVSGRSEIGFVDWMRMDMRYITRSSVWLDLQLLLRSVPAVLSGRGAY